ncbi:Sulfurtransferase tusE [Candidatus Blochmanniella vafra str. BVAF]|uniref:Sulfurtransferase n=1 Tax=Blochmanniella vafra (strain BVAF) TaxID=859654 RepID=E8Q6B4_BLOVB|nr:TusE/DsrC/DsvC family sulfur relay protein [Candidatus Blochmannia vafer]ADV33808.1 Sulfurtransferase tusE [Candidatus Blochmannia vafer str. BVAF]
MKQDQFNINTDLEGYLINFEDWNSKIAIKLANSEGIKLNKIHWDLIYFVRMFYKEYKMLPKIQTLISIITLKHGQIKGNSRYLIKLFPKKSVTQQISKIAGLPKPKKCL